MTTNVWSRVSTVLEKSTLNKDPPEKVVIDTKTIRTILGLTLFQSLVTASVFSIRDGIGTAWLIPVFTLLQVGWVWDKVLFTWGGPENSVLLENTEDSEDSEKDIKIPQSPFISTVFPREQQKVFTGSIADGHGIKSNPVVE